MAALHPAGEGSWAAPAGQRPPAVVLPTAGVAGLDHEHRRLVRYCRRRGVDEK